VLGVIANKKRGEVEVVLAPRDDWTAYGRFYSERIRWWKERSEEINELGMSTTPDRSDWLPVE
jgi:hypothetical protein